MNLGNTVHIRREPKKRTTAQASEQQAKELPNCGTVEYISPHGWALVRVNSRRTGKPIYAEAFDVCQLQALRRSKENIKARRYEIKKVIKCNRGNRL